VDDVSHVNQLKGYYASSQLAFCIEWCNDARRMGVGQDFFSFLLAKYVLWFGACVPNLACLLMIQPPTIAPINAIWASSLIGNISQTMHWKLMNTCRHVFWPSIFHVHTESQVIALYGSAPSSMSLPGGDQIWCPESYLEKAPVGS
jgi:hypothetical protein